ncbi:MAG: phosphotransferase enzyme family protein [Candidatus Limnocylindrales bacterium]
MREYVLVEASALSDVELRKWARAQRRSRATSSGRSQDSRAQLMSSDPDVASGNIVEHVRATYGLDARHIALIAGRAHAEATVYRIDGHDGPYFLKLTPDHGGAPSPLARYLADSGISRVLAPLRTRDGRLSAKLGDRQASLYPFIEGENGFQTLLNEDQWTSLGRVVRAIHDVKLPSSVREVIRKETYSDTWRSKTRQYLAVVPSGHLDDSVARALIRFLSSKRAVITMLVEHAEVLVPALHRKTLPAVPCHGDLHAGNVLGDGVGSLMIVDWDDPVLAPKERDLMFVGAGIGGVWNREAESAAFYRGYGLTTIDAEALAYYRCERIVEDVAVYCDQLLLVDDDHGADREQMLSKLVSAFDPNDVVEIAKRTFADL